MVGLLSSLPVLGLTTDEGMVLGFSLSKSKSEVFRSFYFVLEA